jgi:hypothetical protein
VPVCSTLGFSASGFSAVTVLLQVKK